MDNTNSYTRYKPIISAHSYYHDKQLEKDQQDSENRIEQIEKDFNLREGALLGERVRRRKDQFAQALHGKGKETNIQNLLKEVVFETFLDALYIDSNAKKENIGMLRTVFNEHYDSVGAHDVFSGIRVLGPLAAKSYSKNPLLFKLRSLCESAVNKFADRRSEEIKGLEHDQLIDKLLDFDMTEEEHNEFVYDKENIQLDDISDAIKDRVVNTIIEEKRISEEEAEKEEELKNSGVDDDDEYGTVTESFHRPDNLLKHNPTIFMSIMESVVQHTIENSTPLYEKSNDTLKFQNQHELATHSGPDHYHDTHRMDGKDHHRFPENIRDTTMEGAASIATMINRERRKAEPENNYQTMDGDANDMLHDEYPTRRIDIDRDMVLADSLIHYTLLETFHSLKIMEQTPETVQELCMALKTRN